MNDLLSRKLILVTGKGGVGKTTIALSLALLAAEQGRRCLLVEIDTSGLFAMRFGKKPLPPGQEQELWPSLFSMVVEGHAALDEYLKMILPSVVAKPILKSRIYDYFVTGAPGLKELMCMGKIFFEVEDRKEGDKPAWDLVIVDAPATGHGLEYLRMPQAAHDTFSVGLVHRETQRVLALLRDPKKTAHLLVTLPEELPVSETMELFQALFHKMNFPVGPIIVNRFHPDLLAPSSLEDLEAFEESLGSSNTLQDQEQLQDLLLQAKNLAQMHERNQFHLTRLSQELEHPRVVLPALFEPSLTPDVLEPLLRTLDEQLHQIQQLPRPTPDRSLTEAP